MTRKYLLVIEGDEHGYSAHVPELPTILVTGRSVDELTERAAEAFRLYWETAPVLPSSAAFVKEIEIDLPA